MSGGCLTTSAQVYELPDLPPGTPYAFDDGSLAGLLQISRKMLWANIKMNEVGDSIHAHHLIPKKGGRVRHVYEPKAFIARVQRNAMAYLINPLQEQLGNHVTAYRRGVNFFKAIQDIHFPPCDVCDTHQGNVAPPPHPCYRQGHYLHLDITDFFHSVRRYHVRKAFRAYGYSHEVASLIAGLFTVRLPHTQRYPKDMAVAPRTPQGFPASGAICNIVANVCFDQPIIKRLEQLNKEFKIPEKYKLVYSRYADDISVLCGLRLEEKKADKIRREITQILRRHKFYINKKKTRISKRYDGKKLLGISFARKHNIPKEQYRTLRAILHNHGQTSYQHLCHSLDTTPGQFAAMLVGKLNWFAQINPEKTAALIAREPKAWEKIQRDLQIVEEN